jgi:hypothetical protein
VTETNARDNEAGSSKENVARYSKETMCKRKNAERTPRMSFGFTDVDDDGEERPQCLSGMQILAADCMKLNKPKRHLESVGKHLNYFVEKKMISVSKTQHF